MKPSWHSMHESRFEASDFAGMLFGSEIG